MKMSARSDKENHHQNQIEVSRDEIAMTPGADLSNSLQAGLTAGTRNFGCRPKRSFSRPRSAAVCWRWAPAR